MKILRQISDLFWEDKPELRSNAWTLKPPLVAPVDSVLAMDGKLFQAYE